MRLAVAGLACLPLLLGPAASAAPNVWTEPPQSLRFGEAEGVALTTRGALFAAPRIVRLGEGRTPGEPNQVWSMASDSQGNLFLGTGPDGRIVKVAPSGKQTLHFTVAEPLVTALAVDRGGDLLAGTAPGGVIYRVRPNGQGEKWCETEERYVWALAVARDGTVYAGTGEHGKVLKLDASGRADPWFDSDEPHIVSLAIRPDGSLLAGGAGRGLLYEVDREGHGAVLFEDDLPEVAALALDRGGNALVAFVAPPDPEIRRPAVQLLLPSGAEVGAADESLGSLDESTGPVLRGYIEGLPPREETQAPRPRGRLLRITPDGRSTELWSSTAEAPFALVEHDGALLFGTGEPARVYRVEEDGDVALLASLREAQVTGLLAAGKALYLATSNPAAAYRLDAGAAEDGVFVSRPLDAGGTARWGAMRWRLDGPSGPGRVELSTRTGNSRDPDGTWSAWGPALTDPVASRVVNPDGRYLQWRARFVGGPPDNLRLSTLSVHYEPYNRPPEVRDFRLATGEGAVAGPATFVWSWRDPDRDPVDLLLEYRAPGGAWTPVPRGEPRPDRPDATTWSEDRTVWDTTAVGEGEYEVRATASDRGANDPSAASTTEVGERLRLVVDRGAPHFAERSRKDGRAEIVLEDERSSIRRLDVLEGGRLVASPRPVDGICDSRSESFLIELPGPGTSWILRGFDAAGNVSEFPLSR